MKAREIKELASALHSEALKFSVEPCTGIDAVKLTSSFVDRNGVVFTLFAYKRPGETRLYLTDGGSILSDLQRSGMEVKLNLLQSLLRSFNLIITQEGSVVEQTDRPQWQRIWSLFQAWAAVDGVVRTWARE